MKILRKVVKSRSSKQIKIWENREDDILSFKSFLNSFNKKLDLNFSSNNTMITDWYINYFSDKLPDELVFLFIINLLDYSKVS